MKIEEIIDEYKKGNKHVVNELPNYIDKMIYTICAKYTNVDTTEDLYQDAWLAVMKSLNEFDTTRGVKFTTYLYSRINYHLLRLSSNTSKFRNKYDGDNIERQFISLDFGEDGMTSEPLYSSTYDLDHEIEIRHKFEVFNNYLNTISERDKKIMQMRADEISFAEIGRRIKCPKSTVERAAKLHQANLKYIIERGAIQVG